MGRDVSNAGVGALFFLTVALLGLGTVGNGCGGSSKDGASSDAKPKERIQPVEVATVRVAPFARMLELSGTLSATDSVDVVARVEGPITDLNVDLGDRVAKNAVLAKVETEDFAARFLQADAQRKQADSDVARLEKLLASQMATPQAMEQAKTQAAVAAASAMLAERQLRDATVRAPFEGAISRRDISVGAYVKVGAPLFQLVSAHAIRLVLEVPERYLGLVQPGAIVKIHVGGKDVEAPVSRVAPTVDVATRTQRVEATVPADAHLTAGMFVTTTVDVGVEPKAARVPRPSVINVLGRNRVLLVKGGRVEVREVTFLGEEGTDAVVTNLSEGDVVIARGAATLAPGTAVQPSTGSGLAAAAAQGPP